MVVARDYGNGSFNGLALVCVYLFFGCTIYAQNPIVPNMGVNDPHIHIFNDTAYLYATHDKSIDNTQFVMEDWWIWSSVDLVNWELRSVLDPVVTYLGESFSSCWATDAAQKDGKYYWYFSEGNQQTGVVVGDSPIGPWYDPLNRPLLSEDLTSSDEYDPSIFQEGDDFFIVFGVWDYYVAQLADNMIQLAEQPQKLIVNNPRGPYNLDGYNMAQPTDDKVFLHKYDNTYYLSWGCFYATSDSLYGPYDYKGIIINEKSFATGYDSPTWPTGFLQGRHGSFFEWHEQWYFAYCDMSQTGNRRFRDTFIGYIHYRTNGEIAPIRVDGVGVGNYFVEIEAEDFFQKWGIDKYEYEPLEFAMRPTQDSSWLYYPNVDVNGADSVEINIIANQNQSCEILMHTDLVKENIIGDWSTELNPGVNTMRFPIDYDENEIFDLYLFIKIKNLDAVYIDSFKFH